MDRIKYFDELNTLAQYRIQALANMAGADGTEEFTEDAIDEILFYLIDSYVAGSNAVNEELGTDIELRLEDMQREIYRPIAGKTFEERIREYASEMNLASIAEVTRTDTHRVFEAAAYQTALKAGALYKVWNTTLDGKERDTHAYLEGMRVPIGQEFYTYTGAHSQFPSEFGTPEEDCNCRCWLTYSM